VRAREDQLVADWAQALEDWLSSLRGVLREFDQGRMVVRDEEDHPVVNRAVFARELAQAESLHDLVRRGLDPDQQRTFRGRVLLTVRCPRGHLLALVYPTARHPVLVPAQSALPWYRDKPARTESFELAQRHRMVSEGRVGKDGILRVPEQARDFWLQQERESVMNAVRGMWVLDDLDHPGPARVPDVSALGPVRDLWCRCGRRPLTRPPLVAALNDRARVLTV